MTRDPASQLFVDMLALMHTHRASDLFITADFPPALKIDGVITKASPQSLSPEDTAMLARTLMTERQTLTSIREIRDMAETIEREPVR